MACAVQLFVGQNIRAGIFDLTIHKAMKKWLFHQNGFTGAGLLATVSKFVEENVFLFFQQILYSTLPNVRLVYEKNNRPLLFSGSRKSQPSDPPLSGNLGKPRFTLVWLAVGLGYSCPH